MCASFSSTRVFRNIFLAVSLVVDIETVYDNSFYYQPFHFSFVLLAHPVKPELNFVPL